MIDEALEVCLELALVYKTSPFEFIGRPPYVIAEIYRRTLKTMERLKEAARDD